MGQRLTDGSTKLSDKALDALRRELIEAAEFMDDDQILCVADTLHDALRHRKRSRAATHRETDARLCSGGAAFPF